MSLNPGIKILISATLVSVIAWVVWSIAKKDLKADSLSE